MDDDVAQKAADAGWITGLFVWITSHVAQINGVLQFIILLLTIISLLAAIRYHWKNAK